MLIFKEYIAEKRLLVARYTCSMGNLTSGFKIDQYYPHRDRVYLVWHARAFFTFYLDPYRLEMEPLKRK